MIDDPTDFDVAVDRLLGTPDGPSVVRLPLGVDRDEFLAFCERHPNLRAELAPDGTIEVMSPLVLRSSEHEGVAYGELREWWKRDRVGKVYNSSAGFTLPSGEVRAPDASWVSPERLARLAPEEFDRFARLVPDFVIEVRSKSDKLPRLRRKMTTTWLAAGVLVAWLIDPRKRRAYIYRTGRKVEVVTDFSSCLAGEGGVSGFSLDLREFD